MENQPVSQNHEEPDLNSTILSGLLKQCNSTIDSLIHNLEDDALYWKLEYIKLYKQLLQTCASENGDLLYVIEHARNLASIAEDSIRRTESIY